MVELVISLIIAFMLKLVLIFVISCIIFNYTHDKLESYVFAWIFSYLLMIGLMIILSIPKQLTKDNMLLVMICLILFCLFFVLKKDYLSRYFSVKSLIDYENRYYIILPIVLLIGMIAVIFIRSLYYFDTTADAISYGIPRILLFEQKHSLLFKMNTMSLNIIVNEWNGELNSIYYRMMTGKDQSIQFSNAENYFFGCISIYWVCKNIDLPVKTRSAITLLFCTMPVVIFLALTCKGDLLPIFLMPIIYILILKYNESKEKKKFFYLFTILATSGLCAGAKITMVPYVGLVLILLLFDVIKSEGLNSILKNIILMIFGMVLFTIGCFRYVLNILQFNNPFQRVDAVNEQLSFSLINFTSSIQGLCKDLFSNKNIFTHKGFMWALNTDSGILGFVIILLVIYCIIYGILNYRVLFKLMFKNYIIAIPIIISFIYLLTSTQYLPWSYRYYAPWMGVFFLVSLRSFIFDINIKRTKYIHSLFCYSVFYISILCMLSTFGLTLKTGEVKAKKLNEMINMTTIQRKFSLHNYVLDEYGDVYQEISKNRNVLSCNSTASFILQLFGDNNDNQVTLCTIEELPSIMNKIDFDVVSISNTLYSDNLLTSFPQSEWKMFVPTSTEQHIFYKYEYPNNFNPLENKHLENFCDGIYANEGLFHWTTHEATIPLNISFEKGLKIVYNAGINLQLNSKDDKQLQVNIYVDGKNVAMVPITETRQYEIIIDKEILPINKGIHEIKIVTNGYLNPKELGASSDDRNLCVQLIYIGEP